MLNPDSAEIIPGNRWLEAPHVFLHCIQRRMRRHEVIRLILEQPAMDAAGDFDPLLENQFPPRLVEQPVHLHAAGGDAGSTAAVAWGERDEIILLRIL